MHILPLDFKILQNAAKVPAPGKSKKRIEFTDLSHSKSYLIAYDSILKSKDASSPKLGYLSSKRFFLIKVSDSEYVKVNKNSFLKRFGISKREFSKQKKLHHGDINPVVVAQIEKAKLLEEHFGYLTPTQRSKIRPDYVIEEHTDGSVFLGHKKDGERSGYGFLKLPDGKMFEGHFKEGQFHGKGFMSDPKGDRCAYTFKNGQKEGIAKITFANGNIFLGKFKADRMIQGKMTHIHGKKLKAKFTMYSPAEGVLEISKAGRIDRFKGTFDEWGCLKEGSLILFDGSVFNGKFEGWEPHDGHLRYPPGNLFIEYQGSLQPDGKYDRGKLTFHDGSIFEGLFEQGRIKQGHLIYADGREFSGTYDRRGYCEGLLYFPDGRLFAGQCKNGGAPLKGFMQFPEGHHLISYNGTFRHNENFLMGKVSYPDGSWYDGLFDEQGDYKDGIAFYKVNDESQNGIRAQGEMFFPDGRELFEFDGTFYEDGRMKMGKLVFADHRTFIGLLDQAGNIIQGKMTYPDGREQEFLDE
ncbi:hypothetical protein [Parachlamydia acanthamoebae]|uniref:hypothetical protein n=1 Tax=Parachlamydia acanthamoebae TaxID=83552 RepID=UPI00075090DF|nr:hypothetical protein [Parachlamydia acanthamoebae]